MANYILEDVEEDKDDIIATAIKKNGKFKQSKIIYDLPNDLYDRLTEDALLVQQGRYKSPVLEGASYLDMVVLANDMLHVNNNFHNIFLESIEYQGEKNGIKIYTFKMGS